MKLVSVVLVALVLVCAAGCATRDHETQRNGQIIRRYFDEWANHGSTAAADELIAADLTLNNPPTTLHSLDEYKASMAKFHAGFPDLRFTIENQIARGDRVVVRWSLRGTNRGEFAGQPPTGKSVAITGTSIFRIAGGKIREIWVSMDRLGLMQQLGWTLSAPRAASGTNR